MSKLSINFEEKLLRAHRHFEEQSNVLDSSIITINYCIIINAYYNFIVKLLNNKITVVLIKASLGMAIRKKMCNCLGAATTFCLKCASAWGLPLLSVSK